MRIRIFKKSPQQVITSIITIMVTSITLSIVVNPMDFLRFQRDRQRISDLKQLSQLVSVMKDQNPAAIKGVKGVVYTSLPDESSDCSHWQERGLPPLSSGYSYHCVSKEKYRNVDGSGWMPIDFSANKKIFIKKLPIDPANGKKLYKPEENKMVLNFYQYIIGSFTLAANLELPPKLDEQFSGKTEEVANDILLDRGVAGVHHLGGFAIAAANRKTAVKLLASTSQVSANTVIFDKKIGQATLQSISEISSRLRQTLPKKAGAEVAATQLFQELGVKNPPLKVIKQIAIRPVRQYLRAVDESAKKEFKKQKEIIRAIEKNRENFSEIVPEPIHDKPVFKSVSVPEDIPKSTPDMESKSSSILESAPEALPIIPLDESSVTEKAKVVPISETQSKSEPKPASVPIFNLPTEQPTEQSPSLPASNNPPILDSASSTPSLLGKSSLGNSSTEPPNEESLPLSPPEPEPEPVLRPASSNSNDCRTLSSGQKIARCGIDPTTCPGGAIESICF